MGREVKRVALDFDWPQKEVWSGYLNPHDRQCSACEGSGVTTARLRLQELVTLILLSAEDTRRTRGIISHPYFSEMSALHRTQSIVVSADIVPVAEGLSDRKLGDSWIDSVASSAALKKVIAAAGLDEKWGECPACDGLGDDPTTREASEAWMETEPPAGEGWQMWETASEGSPISPVCKTPEELARWLADNKASTFGDSTADYETWLRMIVGDARAPSMVVGADGKMMIGVDFVARHKD